MANDSHLIEELEHNFLRRNIAVLWFEAFADVKAYLLEKIPLDVTIGIGHAKSLGQPIRKSGCSNETRFWRTAIYQEPMPSQ